jgi:hypothetical protein
MVHAMSVQATATAMIELLAKTAVDTRVVQSALHMVATIAHLAQVTVTHVLHTVTAMIVVLVEETAQLTAVQVQLPVAATVAK